MSREWTPDEPAAVSAAMKAAGYMSYEEFCAALAPLLDLQVGAARADERINGWE